ncbi:MAG: hypothetical protein AAGF92_02215 [Myxococcota bacterium]
MTNRRTILLALALALVAGALWLDSRPVGSQVTNQDQRTIRALESQAQSLKSIASSLKKIERCK